MMGFMIGFFSLVIQDMYTKSIWFQYSLKKRKITNQKKDKHTFQLQTFDITMTIGQMTVGLTQKIISRAIKYNIIILSKLGTV